MTETSTSWAKEKAQEIIRKNDITSDWKEFNNMQGVTAMGSDMTADIVVAFSEVGYEMRQLGQNWEIRKK